MVTNISYIYGLYSSQDSERIKYIGYSFNPLKRLKQHITESKKLRYRRHKWIQSEINKGNTIGLEVLRCVSEKDISKAEIETILLYKSCGANLTNDNNGGLGGITPTEEVRKKLSISKLGNTWGFKKGRKVSLEEIEKMRVLGSRPKSKLHLQHINEAAFKRRGIPHPNFTLRILSEETIINIFDLYNSNQSVAQIANTLKIKKGTVGNIVYNKIYYKEIKEKHNLAILEDRKKQTAPQYSKKLR